MKNLFEVLKQKEYELQQLQKEMEILRAAAALLADEGDAESVLLKPKPIPAPVSSRSAVSPQRENGHSAAWENTPRQFP